MSAWALAQRDRGAAAAAKRAVGGRPKHSLALAALRDHDGGEQPAEYTAAR